MARKEELEEEVQKLRQALSTVESKLGVVLSKSS
jgi:hypothetical protein